MPSLQVSLSTNRPDEDALMRCLHALSASIDFARNEGTVGAVNIAMIDNSRDEENHHRQIELSELFFKPPVEVQYLNGHANLGLGAGYNLSLHGSGADFHLILREHAELAKDAIAEGVSWMQANDDVGLATAALFSPNGMLVYPCLRYPTAFDLWLSYLAPLCVKRLFHKRLNDFEMVMPVTKQETFSDMSCVMGDCLIARRSVTDQSGGFDPLFFQYFGDLDLSLRLGLIARVAYLPNMRATVYPSEDGSVEKHPTHTWRFLKDGMTFLRKNHCRLF
jgi:GT2 family glycosyltransferase